MVDTIAMSANAERVIKPRTFISPKPGLRRRVCVARSSLRLPRAAVKRPRFRRGLVSGAQRRLQITWNGNHAQPGRFIFATIRGSRLLQGCDGVIVGSHSGSSGAPRAVHGVLRVRNLVGGRGHYLNSQIELGSGVLDLIRTHYGLKRQQPRLASPASRSWPL